MRIAQGLLSKRHAMKVLAVIHTETGKSESERKVEEQGLGRGISAPLRMGHLKQVGTRRLALRSSLPVPAKIRKRNVKFPTINTRLRSRPGGDRPGINPAPCRADRS
jgi:hypothetical protein